MRVRVGVIAVVGALGVHAMLAVGLAHLSRRGPVLTSSMFAQSKAAPPVVAPAAPPAAQPSAPLSQLPQPRKLAHHPRSLENKPIRHVAHGATRPAPPPALPPIFDLDPETATTVEGAR
jgi:hypothetical protein